MNVKIGTETYNELKNLSYGPQTDISGDSLHIDEFSVDIITDDNIVAGQYAELYSELDENDPWAKFWIIDAERIESAGVVTVRAQSLLANAEHVTMPAVWYDETSNATVTTCLSPVALATGITNSTDHSLANIPVVGVLPEQSAKDRIQWLCFIARAYVHTCWHELDIDIIDTEAETVIPINQTFWRPRISYTDWVESVSITEYSFSSGTPQQGDKTIDVNGSTLIYTEQTHTLVNPDIPLGVHGKNIKFNGLYIVNDDNWSDILAYLATLYFNRVEVDADIICNQLEYKPGDKVTVYLDDTRMVSGFIESMQFAFGVQARASIHLNGVADVGAAKLIIKYKYQDTQLGKKTYLFPVGYEYELENPYLDKSGAKHRYVYRPQNEKCTGTMASGTNTKTEPYDMALHYYVDSQILLILSVYAVAESGDTGIIVIG